jgi:O-antigen ligase
MISKNSIKHFKTFLKKDYFIDYIYLYIFLLPWDFWKPKMGVLSLILFIWWLILAKRRSYFQKLKTIQNVTALKLFLLFFLYAFSSLLWSNNIYSAFHTYFQFFKYALIMIPVLYTSLSINEAKNSLYIFSISLILYAFFSLGIYFELYTIHGSNKVNPKGFMAYAIITPYMAISTLFFIIFAFFAHSKQKIIFTLFAIISFIALFINNGRAGQLAFFFTIILFGFLFRKKIINNMKIFFLGILTILLSIFLLYNFNKLNRFTHAFYELKNPQSKNFSGSWGQREYLWYAAGTIMKNNPLIGIGVGDNIDALKQYEKKHKSQADYIGTFHNQHLDTLTRFGIIGYILFILPIIIVLYKLRNKQFYFLLAISFFSITFFDSIGDIIILMKPYNNIYILMFILFCILAYKKPISST